MVATSPVGNQPSTSGDVVLAEITVDHPRSAHMQIAERDAVPRQFTPVVADDLHVDAIDHVPLLLEQLALLFERTLALLPRQSWTSVPSGDISVMPHAWITCTP